VAVEVVVEVGKRRTFASALDWPGWSRSGRDEEGALGALEDYRGRYAAVLRVAGVTAVPRGGLTVVEHLVGDATTDFGAPSRPAAAEARAAARAALTRQCGCLAACWAALGTAAAAAPAKLRKGPRGGGRDRDAIVAHVLAAEVAYGRKLGLGRDLDAEQRRQAMLDLLGRPRGRAVLERGWPARYALRRIAWHALDHAFEIEDKAG